MTNHLHARETDLEPSGIAETMRFLDSPGVIFVMIIIIIITDEQHPYEALPHQTSTFWILEEFPWFLQFSNKDFSTKK